MRRAGLPVYGPIADWQHRRVDHWSYQTSAYEQGRFAAAQRAPGAGPFPRCLEVACSEGIFSAMLARDPRIGTLVACDVSPRALARARERLAPFSNVHCRVLDLTGNADLNGPYDLIFCMDVLYYLGVNIAFVARRLTEALAPGGRLVLLHLHPEADKVFWPFVNAPGVQVLSSTVVPDPIRPYQILVLERTDVPSDA
jgi:SAM-dependent methyltransferase